MRGARGGRGARGLAGAGGFCWSTCASVSVAAWCVISVVKGLKRTTAQILAYTIAFVIATLLLPVFGYTGIVYTAVMGSLGLYWICLGIVGLRASDVVAWARRMFRFSLIMVLALCLMISVGPILP